MFGKQWVVLNGGLPDNFLILCPLFHLVFNPSDHLVTFLIVPWIMAGIVMQFFQIFKLGPQKHLFFGDSLRYLIQSLITGE